MRSIEINDRIFKIRSLKRKEVKALRKKGFDLMNLGLDVADQGMDAVFEMIFSKAELEAIDELENRDALRLWWAALKETYGAEDEEKNSSGSGNGTLIGNA